MAGQACERVGMEANFSMPWRRNFVKVYRMYVLDGSHEKMNQQMLFFDFEGG